MGTPQYMAPEQAGGKAKFVGPQADVYALGVILYECLCGTVPFKGEDAWSLIRQVLEDAPLGAAEAGSRCAPRPGTDLPEVPGEGTAPPVPDGRGAGRRPEVLPEQRTGERAAHWARRARHPVGEAAPAAAALVALAVLLVLVVPPLLVWVRARFNQHEADAVQAGEREEAARALARTAKDAEDKAKLAQFAAERLAEARDLFALQNAMHNRASARSLGWTAANRAELPKAVALAAGDRQALVELRSVAACAVLAADLFPLDPVARVMNGSAMATDPKTGRIAVGEFKCWVGGCRVLLINAQTGRIERQLTFPSDLIGTVQDGTRSLAFSPDGTRLFAGTRGSKVVRFDLDEPGSTPARTWRASSGAVEQLAVSPDGKTVYGLCRPEVPVFAWDAETGEARQPFVPSENAAVTSFAVLPSGELLAGNGHALYRWTAEHKLVSTVTNKACFRLAATGGPLLLLADGPSLVVHDRDTGELTDRFTDPAIRRAAHAEYVKTIAVHPSGAFVATAADDSDRTVKVWELASGRLVGTVSAPGTTPIAVAWSGDGKFLLATAEGHVQRWAFAPSEVRRFAHLSGFPLSTAALAPDDRVVAVGHYANGGHEVFVGAPGGPVDVVRVRAGGGNSQPGVALAPDGTFAITLQQPGIFLWKPGAPISPASCTNQPTRCPRFAPTGALWAVAGSKEVHRFDPATKAQRANWRNSLGDVLNGLSSLDALAVGRTVAVAAGREGTLFLLDPVTCEPTSTFRSAGDPVLSVALAPDDSLIVAGTQNGNLRVVRIADKTEFPAVPAHPKGVTAVSINRDGTLLATGGRDSTVRLWKRAGDRFELLLAVAHLPGLVRELQFAPSDGRLLVLLDHDHAVRIWDVDRLNAQLAELEIGMVTGCGSSLCSLVGSRSSVRLCRIGEARRRIRDPVPPWLASRKREP